MEGKFGKWTFNFTEDDIWNYDLFNNKEDAIIEGKCVAKNNGLDHFYIGKTKEPIFSAIDGESYLEAAAESLGYEVGVELSDQWYESVDLKDINKLEEMLDNTFEKWKKETNNIPKCYSIIEVEEIKL
ncbi:MAG: Uncharacterized protein AWU54_318 [Candidatus Frackibacter sp. T328-2]|nr:MAG: Uncharacterized protein AWU54_318 [Candidatus Frackibacter sp. T328-2]